MKAKPSMKSFPLSKVYGLLEPGPVVLLTTARADRTNIMAMSWHTMLEFEPPLVACVVSNRNYSFGLLKASRECVIANWQVSAPGHRVMSARCSASCAPKPACVSSA